MKFIWGSSNPTCGQAVRAALLMFLVDPFGSLVWLRYQLYQGLRACLHHHGAEVVELPAMVNDDVGHCHWRNRWGYQQAFGQADGKSPGSGGVEGAPAMQDFQASQHLRYTCGG